MAIGKKSSSPIGAWSGQSGGPDAAPMALKTLFVLSGFPRLARQGLNDIATSWLKAYHEMRPKDFLRIQICARRRKRAPRLQTPFEVHSGVLRFWNNELENELQAKLNLPRSCSGIGLADLKRRNAKSSRRAKGIARLPKLHPVEQIVEFKAQL